MNRTYWLFLAALFCYSAMAQQIRVGVQQPGAAQQGVFSFQPAQSLAVGRGGRGVAMAFPREEKGKPFSAKVTTQTVQTFIDGTHVSQTATMLEYRDAEGRVRTETSRTGNPVPTIVIRDTVARFTYRLDPATKSAVRAAMAGLAVAEGTGLSARAARGGAAAQASAQTPQEAVARLKELVDGQLALARAEEVAQLAEVIRQAARNPNEVVEDLGMALVNGVQARGTKTTTIVPVGAIGNDREFRSVDERWFSSDLNLLIKSINTDPRFGTTTYELTNISRQPPDPSLFQIPADYTVSTGGRGKP
jgi:hypothetical protein